MILSNVNLSYPFINSTEELSCSIVSSIVVQCVSAYLSSVPQYAPARQYTKQYQAILLSNAANRLVRQRDTTAIERSAFTSEIQAFQSVKAD